MITDHQGREWVTAEDVREQVGNRLSDARLRQWKRRRKVRGQRIGRVNYYLLDDVLIADRDMPRSSVPPAVMQLAPA